MSAVKTAAREIIERLPEDADWEDLMYQLYVREKIEIYKKNSQIAADVGRGLVADFVPDVIHCHDWQAGLAPVYLRTRFAGNPRIGSMASIFTIHNLAYQGSFPPDRLEPLDLPPSVMAIDGVEFWNQMSFLKGGINYSRIITTVSPTYAKEIQTEEYGAGFEGVLAGRAADLYGVLNGIDTDRWDPSRDPYLPEPYDEHSLEKKDASRRELLETIGVRTTASQLPRPLIGLVSRLVDQKGFDLIAIAVKLNYPMSDGIVEQRADGVAEDAA